MEGAWRCSERYSHSSNGGDFQAPGLHTTSCTRKDAPPNNEQHVKGCWLLPHGAAWENSPQCRPIGVCEAMPEYFVNNNISAQVSCFP
eukprot:1156753-Pelagomonas_calceolata.AAC.6